MKLSVDTARFILFLYIQNIPRLSLKSSLLTGEEYPIQVLTVFPYVMLWRESDINSSIG